MIRNEMQQIEKKMKKKQEISNCCVVQENQTMNELINALVTIHKKDLPGQFPGCFGLLFYRPARDPGDLARVPGYF